MGLRADIAALLAVLPQLMPLWVVMALRPAAKPKPPQKEGEE